MKLTAQRNQCQSCNKYFNSNLAFDKHRVGQYGESKLMKGQLPGPRRCATDREMAEAGMSISSTGWWISSKMKDEVMFPPRV